MHILPNANMSRVLMMYYSSLGNLKFSSTIIIIPTLYAGSMNSFTFGKYIEHTALYLILNTRL